MGAAYLKEWTIRATRSRIEPMKKIRWPGSCVFARISCSTRPKGPNTNAMFEGMSPHGAGLACGQSLAIGFEVLKFDCCHDRGELSTLSLIQILLTRQEAEIERTVALMV